MPVIYLAKGARVMLTMNIWTKVGLCNGAPGTVLDFVHADGQTPSALRICVLVQFDEDYIVDLFRLQVFQDAFQFV